MPDNLPSPLVRYLKVQRLLDRELVLLLERASNAAQAHLNQLGPGKLGDEIRARQVRAAQAAINREMAKAWLNMGDATRAAQLIAAAEAIESVFDPMRPLLRAAGFSNARIDAMLRSQTATAERGVRNAVTRVTVSKIPLSEKVYHTRVLANGQLDAVITNAIARGVSAKELASAVRGFIHPDTPGGASYAAKRLGRTELNNAFHGTQVVNAQASPFVTAMRWHLSGSHPQPDECNDYAEGGDRGGGLWTPENVPSKPHPQCLCYLEPETPSREEFLRRFGSGEYNTWIDEQGVA